MAEHPSNSIKIDSDRQYEYSTLASRTESQKSTVVTPNKEYETVLPPGNKTSLYKSPKISSNKEDNPKYNKFANDIEEDIELHKTHKYKDNSDDYIKPSNYSPDNPSSKYNQPI